MWKNLTLSALQFFSVSDVQLPCLPSTSPIITFPQFWPSAVSVRGFQILLFKMAQRDELAFTVTWPTGVPRGCSLKKLVEETRWRNMLQKFEETLSKSFELPFLFIRSFRLCLQCTPIKHETGVPRILHVSVQALLVTSSHFMEDYLTRHGQRNGQHKQHIIAPVLGYWPRKIYGAKHHVPGQDHLRETNQITTNPYKSLQIPINHYKSL